MPREIVTSDGLQFHFRDYELPPLGAHDVRVQTRFAAPKHGTESHALAGSALDSKRWDPELRLFLPRENATPGENAKSPAPSGVRAVGNIVVGDVVAVGPEVKKFRLGEAVFGYGPVREETQAPEDRWRLLHGLSYEDAVCTDPAHVALVAVRDGNIRIGDTVAVFGLGAIGLLAVQIARAGGAQRVFAIDPVALRRNCATQHGAHEAFDPGTADVALAIKRATGNSGVDVAIETSGNSRALHEAIRCIRQCGTVVHVPWGPQSATELHLDEEFHLNRPTIIGSQAVWDNPDRSHPLWNEERARETAINLFHDGLITGRDLVTPIVPFEDAPQALAAAFTHPEQSIKIGLRFSMDELMKG